MSNASQMAARQGWEFYSAAPSTPSRDEVNMAMTSAGLPPVSKRTYDHYRRLSKHGVDTYMPINELDVAVKNGTLRRTSVRAPIR